MFIRTIIDQRRNSVRVKLGDQEYSPQEISAMILRKLRDRASAQVGQTVTKAVITDSPAT